MIPLEILDHIARHAPRAINTYMTCLAKEDDEGVIVFTKSQIRDDFSESYCKFKNDLRTLAREDLLEWHEMEDFLHVTLAENDYGEDDYAGM